MSTVSNATKTVLRPRRRPGVGATSYATSKRAFGCGEAVKDLPVPSFIHEYNHYMNSVDEADQLRSYYHTQRSHYNAWKPLWHWLLDLAVINAYKLSNYTDHNKFRGDLTEKLFEASDRPRPRFQNTASHLLQTKGRTEGHTLVKGPQRCCKACGEGGRSAETKKKRKVLGELSLNSQWHGERVKRVKRTNYYCSLCDVPLCQSGPCLAEHLAVVAAKGMQSSRYM